MTMTRFERWSVWLTTLGTLVTGVVYWWMADILEPSEPWAVINHPLQPWVLKAHILIAPLLVFSVGLITMRHIWHHYRMGVAKGRRTGLITVMALAPLVASGYILQVLTAETLLRIVGWTHLGLGIVYSLGVAAHWPATRRRPAATARSTPGSGTAARPAGLGPERAPGHDRRRRRGARREAARVD
jgi:hypothetical protein